MIEVQESLVSRAAELKRAFDASFTVPPQLDEGVAIDFISIRIGQDSYVVRLSEIAGLFVDVDVTHYEGAFAAFRGLAGFRGVLMPVYDLGAILGYPSSGHRWMLTAAGAPVAFSFERFECHLRLRSSVIAEDRTGAGGHTRQIAQGPGRDRPIISIPSVVAAIRGRTAADPSHKE